MKRNFLFLVEKEKKMKNVSVVQGKNCRKWRLNNERRKIKELQTLEHKFIDEFVDLFQVRSLEFQELF